MKTTKQHTTEPWTAGQQRSIHNLDYTHCVWGPDGDSICNCNGVINPNEANAARIVACVNACAGLADPAADLAALREALQAILDSENGATLMDGGSILGNGLADQARAALARVQGKEAE